MDTKQLINEALSLANLGSGREGPETNEQAIMLAQAYAQIAIAQELARLNEQLASVIGTSNSGKTKWIETYNNRNPPP